MDTVQKTSGSEYFFTSYTMPKSNRAIGVNAELTTDIIKQLLAFTLHSYQLLNENSI